MVVSCIRAHEWAVSDSGQTAQKDLNAPTFLYGLLSTRVHSAIEKRNWGLPESGKSPGKRGGDQNGGRKNRDEIFVGADGPHVSITVGSKPADLAFTL